jgi:hypothetical protein
MNNYPNGPQQDPNQQHPYQQGPPYDGQPQYPPYDPNNFHAQPTAEGQYPLPQQSEALPQQQAKPNLKQRFRAMSGWKKFGTIGCSTIIASILLCSLCSVIGNALPAAPVTVQPSPTPTHQPVAKPTRKPKPKLTPTPTPKPSPTPTSTPMPTMTPTPTPIPTQPPVQQPVQQQPPITTGVGGNPWGYDFNPGSLIYNPNSEFCNGVYFSCVTTFWTSTNGYVVECGSGKYSHSGGVKGACSKNGSVQATLYQHP